MSGTPTEEMSFVGKVAHVPFKRNTIAKWASINSIINTLLIATIFLTDGSDRAQALQHLPAVVDGVAARLPLLISIGSALGLAFAAFRKQAYNERASD